MRRVVEIGLLYSREGTYSLMSEACRQGALDAIADINKDSAYDFTLAAVERDPKSNIDCYGLLCSEILQQTSARHIVGCVTSWSRKEVIPSLEKAGGTLWYAVPYEGFEASDHVIYTHACPNQHLLPLLHWTFPRYGRRGFLTGSNYIWGWEMNRVARTEIYDAGGEVLGERYLPIGDTDADRMIEEIRATRPGFILNSLIGASSYAFLHAYERLGREDSYFTAQTCPILSCNLTECEFGPLGSASEGLIAAGPYFQNAVGWPTEGQRGFGSSFQASAYAAVRTLATLLSVTPGAETATLADLLAGQGGASTAIDPATHHAVLPVLIAQVREGAFRVLEQFDNVVADPYLARRERRPTALTPSLRLVR